MRTPLKPPLQHDRLLELLTYFPASGDFVWNVATRRGQGKAGTLAGTPTARGRYLHIQIDRRRYLAHRLAWFYVHKVWPPDEIDHESGDQADNRITNLRTANRAQNNANRRHKRTSRSGLKGVHFHRGKWIASTKRDGKQFYLGSFNSPAEAHAAYCAKAKELFGHFWSAG